jgi:ChrR Cupin-like domain
MNNLTNDKIDIESQEQAQVFELLSERLIEVSSPSQSWLDAMQKRLENRVQTSIAKHASLHTVRARDGIWHNLVAGIRYKRLWQGLQGNSVLVEFAPGSVLPLHRHNFLEEGIVLSGSLQLDDEVLTQFDYHVSPASSCHGRILSNQGALAFLRGTSLGQPLSMFKEVLGGFLPKTEKESESIPADESGWIEINNGVFQKELWTDGTITSRFFRLDAGAILVGHDRPLHEEYMILSGDIFLGDILLQAGDYSLVSVGTEHLDIFTDMGALFFVRGSNETARNYLR